MRSRARAAPPHLHRHDATQYEGSRRRLGALRPSLTRPSRGRVASASERGEGNRRRRSLAPTPHDALRAVTPPRT
jgi:hypothetical protein